MRPTLRRLLDAATTGAAGLLFLTGGALGQPADPLASNNGVYPSADEWDGPLRTANLAYPPPAPSDWPSGADGGPITLETAEAYLARLKAFLEPDLRAMIEDPHAWRPQDHGWYDMVWSGQGQAQPGGGIDPTSGREPLLNTYTGQILPALTWDPPPPVDVQNHAVIYYNAAAAGMLGRLWRDLYAPDLTATQFPEGAIVVKAEAATPSPEQWPVLEGAAVWNVYRPSVATQRAHAADPATPNTPEVLELRAVQMSVAVKDSVASPETGWVYAAFVYDADAEGEGPWDRMTPLGAQWGNDPASATDPSGVGPAGLAETWINPDASGFATRTLGWGGRLSGPMDVATRHDVLTPSGARYEGADRLQASACLSCHGTAQYPFLQNLYPSPNRGFPPDGQPFLLYDPGSPEWAEWFQNRPGAAAMAGAADAAVIGLDYDMVVMFALGAAQAALAGDPPVQTGRHGH